MNKILPNNFLGDLDEQWDVWVNINGKEINEDLYSIRNVQQSSDKSPFQRHWRASFWGKNKLRTISLILPNLKAFKKNLNNQSTNNLKIISGEDFYSTFKKGEKTKFLRIVLLNDEYKDEFNYLIRSIIVNVDNEFNLENVEKVFLKTINKWINFFSTKKKKLLERHQVQGIYAELKFIEDLIQYEPIDKILNCWAGPDGGLHDFVFNDFSFEVKSSLGESITIFSEDQLDSLPSEELILNFRKFDLDENGESINEICSKLRKIIKNKDDLNLFEFKLKIAGYYQENDYDKYKFVQIDNLNYKVDENFPRLIKNDFHNRIFDVSYSINLDSMDSELQISNIFKEILS